MRLLVVEDEIKLANSLKKVLESEAYVVEVAYDGETGYELARWNRMIVFLLDINLPNKDGLAVCRDLRKEGLKTPVLMLTARDSVSPTG
jgi:DNA-binding response OmpR family regulator